MIFENPYLLCSPNLFELLGSFPKVIFPTCRCGMAGRQIAVRVRPLRGTPYVVELQETVCLWVGWL